MILASNYDEINFDALYKAQKARSSFGKKLAEHWDKKAPSFNEGVMKSAYAREFIDKVDFTGVSTLLDFACGAGALSVLATEKVDQIYGYDFSPKMLEFARENAQIYSAKNAKFAQKAFEDDWSDVPACDVVFASRCLEVDDLKAALNKLLSKSKKSLYITFKVGGSFVDGDILDAIGREVEQKPGFVYLLNILFQMGYLPSLSYIKAPCHGGGAKSAEEFVQKTRWMLGGELSGAEEARLAEYFIAANTSQSGILCTGRSCGWTFSATLRSHNAGITYSSRLIILKITNRICSGDRSWYIECKLRIILNLSRKNMS